MAVTKDYDKKRKVKQISVHIWTRDGNGNPIVEIVNSKKFEVPWDESETKHYWIGYEHHIMKAEEQGWIPDRLRGKWSGRNRIPLNFPWDIIETIQTNYKPPYILKERITTTGDIKLKIICGDCGKTMKQSARGPRKNKKGHVKRFFACSNPICDNYLAFEIKRVITPNFIQVPDYGGYLKECSRMIFNELASDGRFHIDISTFSDAYRYDVRADHPSDQFLDEGIDRALTEPQKRKLLRALFFAAYGQENSKNSEEMSRRSKGKSYLQKRYEDEPMLIEIVPSKNDTETAEVDSYDAISIVPF